MKLSVIIPVYNEEKTIQEVVRRVLAVPLGKIKKELVIINDGSTDGTRDKIRSLRLKNKLIIIDKKVNEGKGAAIRDGLKKTAGDVVIIQDADLEYNPDEYSLILEPLLMGKADVVFGSRFVSSRPHRVLYFWHMVGNKLLTFMVNAVTNMNFTDMETCYKAFTRKVAKKIRIEENRFGFEPEFTIKVAKMRFRVYEVGVSYSGRDYEEGKKINWKDGVWALWCVVKYGLISNLRENA
ncbi:glycosyl transferase [Candidatus Amesbacteria bacterium RIFCSPLOWO2_02_FULL_48_11]|uniref:Glycosyl transferase n=5 Tax=Candidatus Amesiibacteriota TaxID=1752730 RepID=A0A1F4ZEF6_9BACT|nr:MAG: Glycosyltransferases involved in cell wall biogenesis [Candidatus Amesbacteria bacterium GW2011_GWA2_47_11]KKU94967.1 MAG: Glycosyltransferases involved in cell wall biogenesis [Candidatus Amesbacteria bacterium GW2011_GWC1_48_10]KKW01115.1 MAG: Glycosyltransferases involved in cell wall biogenesis [Candidatus Amesbacteria bacterium GW2011_GWA1_48_9]OGC90534.1 MAG: glycosyl transferase [Candidatus Amesbacteria bacterium RBG_19FT_COMBO_48_16]OGC95462.1 MAG: glycosyl transferase [Candidat